MHAPAAVAADAVLDDHNPGENGDIAPTLRIRPADDPSVRSDVGVYGPAEVIEQLRDAPTPKSIAITRSSGAGVRANPGSSAPYSPRDGEATELDEITVTGTPEPSFYGELQLLRAQRRLPCLGCDGDARPIPIAVQLGLDVGLTLLRAFFVQPRVRGEPNDEALYQINHGCGQDVPYRCQLP